MAEKMKRVELIVCWDDRTWDAEIFVDVPEQTYEAGEKEVAAYVMANDLVGDNDSCVVHVGVYNWCEGEDEG